MARSLARRLSLGAVGLAALGLLISPAMGQAAPVPQTDTAQARQETYAAAAQAYGVPVDILLAVSYLETRWDTHAGEPSRAAGYGPMHLTDVRAANSTPAAEHHDGEDARGDTARPLTASAARTTNTATPAELPNLDTVGDAAEATGISAAKLRTDPASNIRGGAALLASYQKQLGGARKKSLADWYGAVALYSGSKDAATAASFADEAYSILAEGAARTTDDGQAVKLQARNVKPNHDWLAKAGLRASATGDTECPRTVACEWIPSAYEELGDGDYGHYDLADRPKSQKIRYIIIHDTEGSYPGVINLTQDPNYAASWQYTMRNSDGHIAQHLKAKDVAWQAGNWYINAKSIGIEHEGWAARGTWYSEVMYRTSAKLVRYLAGKYGIPIDRQHILGHDNVPGVTTANIPNMHWDPGPYWDWAHYFALMDRPLFPTGTSRTGMVTIKPDYDHNFLPFTGCEDNPGPPGEDPSNRPMCGEWSSSSVILHTEPRADAPLLKDIGLHQDGSDTTMRVSDIGSRVSTGQQYAVAEVRGDWVAVWYLGQKGWFHNPRGARTALWATGLVVTPKAGKTEVPVYGRAYPEAEAYAGTTIPVQAISPLPYKLLPGQRYVLGEAPASAEYYRAVTFDVFDGTDHVVVRGTTKYYEIQVGHRVGYVMASDVDVLPSWKR
ncbi:N-acetylmuramoyl-L-alanine amidase [Flindersiella endophytica]